MKRISIDKAALKEKLGLNAGGGLTGYIQARTKREKVLLYLLGIIIILSVGVCLMLKPAAAKHDEVNETLLEKQQEQQEMVLAISTLEATKDKIKETKANINDIRPKFNAILVNEDIDSLITGLVVDCGLKPVSLSISSENQTEDGTQATTDDSSGNASDANSNSSDSSADSSSSDSSSTDAKTESSSDNTAGTSDSTEVDGTSLGYDSIVKTEFVTVSVRGTLSQIVTLVGTANASKGISIISYSISKNESTGGDGILSAVISRAKKKSSPYAAELVFKVYQSTEAK